MWGDPRGVLRSVLCSHSSSRPSLAASASHLLSLQGFGIYFSYFLTVTSWVRFITSWTGRKKPHGAGVTEGERAPAGAGFHSWAAAGQPRPVCGARQLLAGLRSLGTRGLEQHGRGASAGSQATWLTLSVPSEGAGWLWGPAGETSGMGVLPAHGTPRRWLRHGENQFARKLTRMSRWVFLVIRFQPQALRTELAGPPSGSAWGHWVILLPPRRKEGGLAEIGLICPYTSLQASVLSPQKGTDTCLILPTPGSSPSPPLYG